MKIVGIDVFGYELGYAHGEYVMSGNRAAVTEDGTLVRIRTDEGLDGWGEITTLGTTYLPTFPRGIRAALAELGPGLIGLDPTNVRNVYQVMDSALMGQGFAKSAIDIACWDLLGKSTEQPISALLGGVLNSDFPLYEAVPLGSPESMADFISARRAEGINRFQLKVGNNPHEDTVRARACVEAGDRDTVIVADSNGGWNISDAKIALKGMADLPIFVEQPCRTTTDCILAHRGSDVPLVLDESIIDSTEVFRAKNDANAVSINLKFGKLGGLTNVARMRDLVQELNMLVSVEDMWGGDVITAATSHVAATTRPESLLMTPFFNDWTDGHVAGHQPRSVKGRGSAPTGPGLGITVDVEALGAPLFVVGN
ncbi:mandelate racemase/muconate lactonizing enzyme family protein [Rhodococcus sp. NPDC057529]|uniref:mandelate racemase/muconate lactonizing enzyme family protein n=1 Tax=Rhodococcus sp. NPDC057529 TaxID=3346158 RepID=UPI00366B3527